MLIIATTSFFSLPFSKDLLYSKIRIIIINCAMLHQKLMPIWCLLRMTHSFVMLDVFTSINYQFMAQHFCFDESRKCPWNIGVALAEKFYSAI